MELITCRNGHRYDPSLTSECPECAMLKSHTVPLAADMGGNGAYNFGGNNFGPAEIGATVELDRNKDSAKQGSTIPVGGTGNGPTMTKPPVIPVKPPVVPPVAPPAPPAPPVTPAEFRTQVVNYDGNFLSRSELPITGWLVCIDGPEKGKDYRLHNENNFVGRGTRNDVCIATDRTVSEDKHAVVTYDSLEKKFYFALSGGAGIVRLNGKAVLMTQEIKYGDRLQIGQGTFLFIPLCGENFQWEE